MKLCVNLLRKAVTTLCESSQLFVFTVTALIIGCLGHHTRHTAAGTYINPGRLVVVMRVYSSHILVVVSMHMLLYENLVHADSCRAPDTERLVQCHLEVGGNIQSMLTEHLNVDDTIYHNHYSSPWIKNQIKRNYLHAANARYGLFHWKFPRLFATPYNNIETLDSDPGEMRELHGYLLHCVERERAVTKSEFKSEIALGTNDLWVRMLCIKLMWLKRSASSMYMYLSPS